MVGEKWLSRFLPLVHRRCTQQRKQSSCNAAWLGLERGSGRRSDGTGPTRLLQQHGLSPLTLAIVLGMVVGNTVLPLRYKLGRAVGPHVRLPKQILLRLGIVLHGQRLTVQDITHVGLAGVVVDALVRASTFGLACWVGTRWLGLDCKTAMLIGACSSICVVAAVMATEPVLRARAEQVTVAVAAVVVFGTVAIFVYPLLFAINQHWGLIPGSAQALGLYAGSTIHEVAQVVAAVRAIGPDAADAALIAKVVRVMMLAPFLVGLSAWLACDEARAGKAKASASTPLAVPWFAFGFIAVVLFNSLHWLSAPVLVFAAVLDAVLLAKAVLGLATQLGSIRKAGIKPLLLAALLFGWLVIAGALINRWVPAMLG